MRIECWFRPPFDVTPQAKDRPVVSAVMAIGTFGTQPDPNSASDSGDSGSDTRHVSVTSDRYQPLAPWMPTTSASITDGVSSTNTEPISMLASTLPAASLPPTT
jgi:hypothetical protein